MWIVSEQSFLVDSLDPLQIDFVKVITNLRRHVDLIHSRVLIVLRRFFDDSSKLIFWRKRQIRFYSLISKHYKEVQHENRYRASSYCLIPVRGERLLCPVVLRWHPSGLRFLSSTSGVLFL